MSFGTIVRETVMLGEQIPIDPIAIQKALTTCDIQGVTGHIKIGPQHDPVGKDAWIIQIVGPKMKFKEKFAAKD